MLGAAQADAFRAELARSFGIARNVGIGAHAELAAEYIRPSHERRHDAGRRIGVDGVGLSGEGLTGGTVERQPVAFLQRHLLAAHGHTHFLALRVDVDVARAGYARGAHAAANHGCVAGHAAARGENALGHFHPVNIVRHGLFAHQDDRSRGGLLHGIVGVEYDGSHRSGENHAANRGARRCRQSLGDGGQRFLRSRIQHRMQKLIELLRIDAQDGFFLADQALVDHVHRDAYRGRTGALAIARLQHVEFAVLDGELEILHVAIVLFQAGGDLVKLAVGRGHQRFQRRDGLRRAHARHHVFALRVHQVLAVEGFLAGGWVAGETHAGGGSIAHVAEDHGLHVHRGAQVIRDVVHLAVVDGAGVEPGAEHGVARHGELLDGFLRKRLAGFLFDQLLVIDDDGLQIFGGQVGVELRFHLLFAAVEHMVEIVLFDVEHHVAEHLDEAAVAIVGEPRIAALALQRQYGLIVQAEVEDGIHHAGHGELCARPHADQQRIFGVAQRLAHLLLELIQRLQHLFMDLVGNLVLVLEIDVADFRRDGEAGRHRQIRPAHFGQPGAFAAEYILHFSVAIGPAWAELVNMFVHNILL